MPAQKTLRDRALEGRWLAVRRWLASPDGAWFVDDAFLGCLPAYTADELLADFGLSANAETRKRLGRLVNEEVGDGC